MISPKAKLRQQQILEAAALCFYKTGFHQTSMQDICEAAGLSPGSLYRYFKSKEALIAALIEHDREENAAFIRQLSEKKDVFEALDALVDAAARSMDNPVYRALYIESVAEGVRNEQVKNLLRQHTDSTVAALEALLKDDPTPAVTARFILAALDGVVSQKALDETLDLTPQIALFKTMLRQLLQKETP